MRRPLLAIVVLCAAGLCAAGPAAAQQAPEYMMPWERAPKQAVIADAETLSDAVVAVGKMQIVRLPGAGRTVISSHPEVADLHIEDPNLLFVFPRLVGQTVVVIADEGLNPIFQIRVRVVRPEDVPTE